MSAPLALQDRQLATGSATFWNDQRKEFMVQQLLARGLTQEYINQFNVPDVKKLMKARPDSRP